MRTTAVAPADAGPRRHPAQRHRLPASAGTTIRDGFAVARPAAPQEN